MLRLVFVSLLMSGTFLAAEEPGPAMLAAPEGWGGETITLPPRFAPDMTLKGFEYIRFAPGMMKPDSDSFFCYAFVFDLQPQPVLTKAVVKDEFLKYYRGLCRAVLKGDVSGVDPSTFTLLLQKVKSGEKDSSDETNADTSAHGAAAQYTGTLDWVEPFATKKRQTLNLEIRTWATGDRNYIFVCASPQSLNSAVWTRLRKIRDDYLKK